MKKIEEFWYCVSPQDNLPLYSETSETNNTTDTINELVKFIELYKAESSSKEFESNNVIKNLVLENPNIIQSIRTLVGVSDKRLYLDLTYLANFYSTENKVEIVKENRRNLKKHTTTFFINQLTKSSNKEVIAQLITDYFIEKGITETLDTFSKLKTEQITTIFNNLISPKEVQQMQAKYRGHGAEQEFAKIFKKCGVAFTPDNKHTNPMAERDPNVDLVSMKIVDRDADNTDCHSFDLVVYDSNKNIRLLVQSLIHSSDPGQYGVNKSDETRSIKQLILNYNSQQDSANKVYLIGSVDGVGFSENPNGTIVKMLNEFDSFFQMNTLFKIPIFLQKVGIINNVDKVFLDKSYFDDEFIEYFKNTYLLDTDITLINEESKDYENHFSAGKGTVYLK